ncbi:MAG TPA: hypothetical protein VGE07_13055 [Herpetosiphonaceae bacterium]
MKKRILLAALIGLATGLLSYGWMTYYNWDVVTQVPGVLNDFTWPYRGAEVLRAGANPYDANLEPLPYDHFAPLYYPLTTVLYALPFTYLPLHVGAACFMGLSSALLAFAATAEGWGGLMVFTGPSYWVAFIMLQWGPLLTAAAFLPALFFPLALLKPNLGVPVALVNFTWRRALVWAGLLLLTLLVLPTWPLDWLDNLKANQHTIPLLLFPGFLLALSAVRWRDKEGRLFMLLCLLPQRLIIYDEIILWAVAKTFRERALLSIAGWATVLTWMLILDKPTMAIEERWVLVGFWLPMLAILVAPAAQKWWAKRKGGELAA